MTRSPTGSIRTILSIDSNSSQFSNGSRSTVFVPSLSTLPDISDFQSSSSAVSRQLSFASSYHIYFNSKIENCGAHLFSKTRREFGLGFQTPSDLFGTKTINSLLLSPQRLNPTRYAQVSSTFYQSSCIVTSLYTF